MSAATTTTAPHLGSHDGHAVADHSGNEHLAMLLFIVSEVVMFGAFFAQYLFARFQADRWPPGDHDAIPLLPLAVGLTLLLTASGFTAHFADSAIKRGDRSLFQGWLAATIVLGLVFLVGQVVEYSLLLDEGLRPSTNVYGGAFFTLTGLHGLHVTGGVIALMVVFARALRGHFSPTNHFGAAGTILYWHFVDVVWFFIIVLLYAPLYLR